MTLLTRPGPRYPIDMFAVCEVMTDESLGSAVDRLAVFNDMMLEMNGEECLDHTYDTFLQVSGAVHTCNTCLTPRTSPPRPGTGPRSASCSGPGCGRPALSSAGTRPLTRSESTPRYVQIALCV